MNKDKLYKFITDPNKETFADLIEEYDFETDNIEHKQIWSEKGQLAKEILALANSGGGIIIFGVKENDDKTTTPCGLDQIKDPAQVNNSIKKYIPTNLKYKVESFKYDRSEYKKLIGKIFQVLIVNDQPELLPFISTSQGSGMLNSTIYVKRNTACVQATYLDVQSLIDRRIETGFISNIDFQDHIDQLKILYKNQPNFISRMLYAHDIGNAAFDKYIEELIKKKKKIIDKVIGIK